MNEADVLIVGGGLAGLCCASQLHKSGISFRILEAAESIGGRVRTDTVDGFLLDRGFQVLLTAYPECKRQLDYEGLQLGPFEPGALVRYRGKFHRFVDPWRCPRHFISTALSPLATLADKLRIARLRNRVSRGSIDQLYRRPEVSTDTQLRDEGFSNHIIEHFFRPFLGGVFLEHELKTSSRKFEFVFRMFSKGKAALPANGMGAIADQIAAGLPEGSIRTNASVQSIEENMVRLADGAEIEASRIVVACDEPAAARLLRNRILPSWHGVTCLYFASERPPINEPILVLNGEGEGIINNLCVPSQVAPSYAPAGQSLISVTVLGLPDFDQEATLTNRVRAQLQDWFGAAVSDWRHLKTYRIPYALPRQDPPTLSPVEKSAQGHSGIVLCGDYLDGASIQGAMISGRRAAEYLMSCLD